MITALPSCREPAAPDPACGSHMAEASVPSAVLSASPWPGPSWALSVPWDAAEGSTGDSQASLHSLVPAGTQLVTHTHQGAGAAKRQGR